MIMRLDGMNGLKAAVLIAVLCAGTVHAQQANSSLSGSQKASDIPHLEFVFEEFVTLGG